MRVALHVVLGVAWVAGQVWLTWRDYRARKAALGLAARHRTGRPTTLNKTVRPGPSATP